MRKMDRRIRHIEQVDLRKLTAHAKHVSCSWHSRTFRGKKVDGKRSSQKALDNKNALDELRWFNQKIGEDGDFDKML